MKKEKIWLSSPHMGGKEQQYINEAFDKNWVAPLGPNVSGLEEDIQDFLFTENTIKGQVAALSSGTAALHLALILLGVKRGDEVICQSMTFAASANPIAYLGATPVFIDSECDTLNLSPEYLREAVIDRIKKGKKPKAIVAVHLYGMPYKVDEIHTIAAEYDIPVIEDSAEALGSSYKGKKCGTFGDIAVLSFNGNKIITTSGGGALISKTMEHKKRAVYLATQARDDAPHYQHSEIGYNYRMSNICAGIGRGQMRVLDDRVKERRKMNSFYEQIFKNNSEIKVQKEPTNDYFCNHWLSVIFFKSGPNQFSKEGLRLHLEKENIESRPLWKPMHMQPVFADAPFYGSNEAEDLFLRGLCLPSGSNLTEEDRGRISKSIQNYIN
ncbi:aminotransferase class I/II-fold pyridoxal phosphate-dependent enzyme [Salegentibacter sp. F188]|uniref:Aminotransferase class I/II-fold pyridoxal phosphate-dependent enzyme n=1 Tax=Autumnicola patrickiae TaxID=3075591 RepID=A0ABU3E1G2_9FLAO|nr:aminotransferase class I/II-fold pyridoxal phosphate-dependent enzyme [Salegentibacter sp. F188]MDT0689840.1 aminotransferase class I/II-fold pyridoxal phosphate-dependent enzyme [Salegentibacter sp. F188]